MEHDAGYHYVCAILLVLFALSNDQPKMNSLALRDLRFLRPSVVETGGLLTDLATP